MSTERLVHDFCCHVCDNKWVMIATHRSQYVNCPRCDNHVVPTAVIRDCDETVGLIQKIIQTDARSLG